MHLLPHLPTLLLALLVFLLARTAPAAEPKSPDPSHLVPTSTERVDPDVYLVRDDRGNWNDDSRGITHQRGPNYVARKILDLSQVPETFWQTVREVRLAAFCCVRDYSAIEQPKANGLDEQLELTVNGHPHLIPTGSGLPAYVERKATGQSMRWHDFAIPKAELVRGPNEFVFRMTPTEGKKPDDYFYLGIDNTVPGGRSWVRMAPKTPWRQDRINAVGATGEYMVRLYLLAGQREISATWRAAANSAEAGTADPHRLILYAGSEGGETRVEWDPSRLDRLSAIKAEIETADPRPFAFSWLDAAGQPLPRPLRARGPKFTADLSPPLAFTPSGLQVPPGVKVLSVRLSAGKGYHPAQRPIDIRPTIEPPAGKSADASPTCRIQADAIDLANDNLQCRFVRKEGRLQLVSLKNRWTATEMVTDGDAGDLWLVEVDAKRYAGSRDFTCRAIEPLAGKPGFRALALCEPAGLEAEFKVWIDSELHLALNLVNRGKKSLDFKSAFPHLSGLKASPRAADDYYFFPMSTLVADVPALIRQGYGDHQALYQVIDLFSPQRGGGLAVWTADPDGRYKVLALRKSLPGQSEVGADRPLCPTADEFKWTNSLPAREGTGLTYEYLRRTRKPGESFVPADAVLWAHAGDWRVPTRRYADWCHRVWKFRPYPSRLHGVNNMIAVGWGRQLLFKDGKYIDDFFKPRGDCYELMSWWEWSPLGPWRTPFDKLADRIGQAAYERWKPYFVTDPVTGQTMWNNQPGDYDGYNQRFGGIKTFRAAVDQYKKRALITLYTDPIRCDDASKIGQAKGKEWGVVNPDGKHVTSYEVWNMCHDVAEYRQWVADAMKRVMRETGADGIRLDEYGHRGWACFNKAHKHTFAEPGCTEWQRAIAETCRLVRAGMDEVAPGSVLTTEHPGYDYLLPYLEGCITYDLTVLASPLRPLECNLQRFLFPECKPYELDHRGADRKLWKRFWNGVASFGAYYPPVLDAILRENAVAFASRDCEPLVPTLAKYLYANRFSSGEKTLYTLYNATGHTYSGEALRLAVPLGQHLVDLVQGRNLAAASPIRIFLRRDESTCIARLPAMLTARRMEGDWTVTTRSAPAGAELVVTAADATVLSRQALSPGQSVRISTKAATPRERPAWARLLLRGELLDAIPLEESK